jgi:hypothetical protein
MNMPTPETIHREKLDSMMVMLPGEFIAESCVSWLKSCADDIVSADRIGGKQLLDIVESGRELAEIGCQIRETLDSQEAFEGSLEWLKSVFGSKIDSPWQCLCELVLKEPKILWDELFEGIFVSRMKHIIGSGFAELSKKIKFEECVAAIVTSTNYKDFQIFSQKSTASGGWSTEKGGVKGVESDHRNRGIAFRFVATNDKDWFGCLDSYFGTEVSEIKDTIDEGSKNILKDLISFLLAYKSSSRVEELAPYLQEQCFDCISTLIVQVEEHLSSLSTTLVKEMKLERTPQTDNNKTLQPPVIVERALFVGKLLVALSFLQQH